MLRRLLIFCIALLCCQQVLAWGSTGHRVIAAIAYEHLTPVVKKEVDYYSKKFSRSHHGITRFMAMSVWPDTLKQRGVDEFNQWHFMPYPYARDGIKPKLHPSKNLVWAVKYNEEQFTHQHSVRKRARALAFIAHLFGDAHQPMHCIQFYDKRFPDGVGDLGGNKYRIKAKRYTSLHSYWDKGGNLLVTKRMRYSRYLKHVRQLAKTLQHQYPWNSLQDQIKQQNPKQWTEASYQIAKNVAYSIPYKGRVTKKYQAETRELSAKQLVLAGYRLAYWLNHHLGKRHDKKDHHSR